jgi:hypothetical protein
MTHSSGMALDAFHVLKTLLWDVVIGDFFLVGSM